MGESVASRAGKKSKRDNTHGLLGVVRAVTMSHPGGTEELEFPKYVVNDVRGKAMEDKEEQKHKQATDNETDDWRGDHRNNDLGEKSGAPLQDPPVAMGGGERGPTEAADESVAGTGRQPQEPGYKIPDNRAGQCAKDCRHGYYFEVDNSFSDCNRHRSAHEGAGEVEERRHRNRLARGQHLGRDDGRDGIGGIMEAVNVFEDEGDENDDKEENHAFVR